MRVGMRVRVRTRVGVCARTRVGALCTKLHKKMEGRTSLFACPAASKMESLRPGLDSSQRGEPAKGLTHDRRSGATLEALLDPGGIPTSDPGKMAVLMGRDLGQLYEHTIDDEEELEDWLGNV